MELQEAGGQVENILGEKNVEEIEALQEAICVRFGYEMVGHRHEIYGICPKCQTA